MRRRPPYGEIENAKKRHLLCPQFFLRRLLRTAQLSSAGGSLLLNEHRNAAIDVAAIAGIGEFSPAVGVD